MVVPDGRRRRVELERVEVAVNCAADSVGTVKEGTEPSKLALLIELKIH